MPTLKGQNLRIYRGTACIALATNCTVTLNGNADDSTTKDTRGMASQPEITSKSWQVSVESLDVATDIVSILTAVKSGTPFTLKWDESAATNNQTALATPFARTGTALLSDATFTFNDRENSTKNLQFTGTGPLEKITDTPTTDIAANLGFTKGQFVRLFLSNDNSAVPSKVIAAAKNLSFHISTTLENSTTKDTEGDWQVQEVTGISYDISTSALVRSADTITSAVEAQYLASIEEIYEASAPVKFQIANVAGENQRTKGAIIVSGSVVITQLTLNGPNRQNATYDTQMQGYGEYTVGA